jgi:hypothetical protein
MDGGGLRSAADIERYVADARAASLPWSLE